MLDVHPPHEAAHTWKDFFIHIATICVGLLIAIGLEQTVEAVHHHHQRVQLEGDLRNEALRNLHLALNNIEDCEASLASGQATYQEVIAARRDHRAPVLQSSAFASRYVKPASAVWTVAQQSGTLGLLPRAEAQRYVRVYSLVDQVNASLVTENAAYNRIQEALGPGRAALTADQRKLDRAAITSAIWAGLDPEDFREARNAVAQHNAAEAYSADRNVLLYGIEWSIVHGSRSDDENLRVMFGVRDAYHEHGKAAMLAKYPAPQADATTVPDPEQ